eukprot:CAMPEP_0195295980 /NCGR_PEP_ID=MMETSP0707-20130614/18489_1 /TAXON_ID=33640 /ORGANISM="Asterionellopsis glacialis, Strain CCMP134" /LENGTH=400 /DNA_ID=CAMNT_0040357339 /DNA_START=1 /DNA_END=1199 /DNA_ORIENTATION=+
MIVVASSPLIMSEVESGTPITMIAAVVAVVFVAGFFMGGFVTVMMGQCSFFLERRRQRQVEAMVQLSQQEAQRGCDGEYAIPVRSHHDMMVAAQELEQQDKSGSINKRISDTGRPSNPTEATEASSFAEEDEFLLDTMSVSTSSSSSLSSVKKNQHRNEPMNNNDAAANNENKEEDHQRFFHISPHDTALLLIDMQTDFVDPTQGRLCKQYSPQVHSEIQQTTRHVERLLQAARKAGLTIAQSRSHRYGASIRKDLVDKDDDGYELAPNLRALEGEIVVDKWTFGAFASTNLEEELRTRGIRKILLGGVLTNVCVFATAVQAVDRFFRVCVVEEATGSFQPHWHTQALNLLNEPQIKPGGHAHNATGLYFGEVAKLQNVLNTLEQIIATVAVDPEKVTPP